MILIKSLEKTANRSCAPSALFCRCPPRRAQHAARQQSLLTSDNDDRGEIIRLTSTSTLRTFELRRDPLSEQWLLAAITDTRTAAA